MTDFGYGGEVSVRPASRPDRRELNAYNYFRRNVAGVQREWWFHRSGCRAWFIAVRDTTTHEVKLTALPGNEAAEGDAGDEPGKRRGRYDPQTPEAAKAGGEGLVT